MQRNITILFLSAAFALTSVAAGASCDKPPDVAAARVRWAAARKSMAVAQQPAEMCRAYGKYFYEAAVVRQAAASCESGAARDRDLESLDTEIDAFNNLIASQCSG